MQSKKKPLKNNLKNHLLNETIITVYFTCEKNQTIGIYQKINFYAPMELDWDKPGLLATSSFIGCFCIKNSKFKNF